MLSNLEDELHDAKMEEEGMEEKQMDEAEGGVLFREEHEKLECPSMMSPLEPRGFHEGSAAIGCVMMRF